MKSIVNPATGVDVGMIIDGFMDELSFPDDETMVYKGGLTRTAANMGRMWCEDASKLFSMQFGMVSLTLRPPSPISGGVYELLAGRENSANPDMVLFCVNPSETHLAQPGLYAALTPQGIEFTVWSSGGFTTIRDNTTSVPKDTDVILSFAWDFSRRIVAGGERASSAILVGQLDPDVSVSNPPAVTAWSGNRIASDDFSSLYAYFPGQSESETEEDQETARFFIGDLPGGKNGLSGIPIRRIEIYKEPYGIEMFTTISIPEPEEYPLASRSEFEVGFEATGMRWVGVSIAEPEFRPTVSEQVNLLDIGTGAPHSSLGVDAGKMEESSYPETPTGLPIGIGESKGR